MAGANARHPARDEAAAAADPIPRETALYGRDPELAKLRALYETAKTVRARWY